MMRALLGGVLATLAVSLLGSGAWAQQTRPAEEPAPREDTQPRGITDLPNTNLPNTGASVTRYPLELLGLLEPQRGGVTLIPSIAISEEYNDNVLATNANKEWDLITSFSPAVALFINRPSYWLSAGYSSHADIYARNSSLDTIFSTGDLLLNGFWQATPSFSFFVYDTYVANRNTSLTSSQGFGIGRQESWSNEFGPSIIWRLTASTSLTAGADYLADRFPGNSGAESDTYRGLIGLRHSFTERLTGTVGYRFTFIDLRNQDDSTTHEPVIGLGYRFTPTLSAFASGGPAITLIGNETFVSPAGTAGIFQRFRFGSASLQYTNDVAVAGGFGGTNNTQSISGTLLVNTLYPGLIITFGPEYSIAKSVTSAQAQPVDVRALTVNVGASYRLARYVNIFAGYTFYQQRTASSSTIQLDADQNRVRIGVQFGYPINFN
jgi:opacity protein-like surface antigen